MIEVTLTVVVILYKYMTDARFRRLEKSINELWRAQDDLKKSTISTT